MAATANKPITDISCNERCSYPGAASTRFYQGCLSFINSSGYLDDDTASGANRFAGVNVGEVNNSSGSNGDLNVEVFNGRMLLVLEGTGFTQASVGQDAYATDNFTVAAGYAANGVKCGVIREYISSTKVRVEIDTTAAKQGAVIAIGGAMKIARGQLTNASAADTVVTGLATVVAVVATLETDPADGTFLVSAQIGDQAGSPAAGSIIIKAWQNTSGNDPTPAAAAAFSKKINWIAIGT